MFGSLLILVIMCSVYSLGAEPTGMLFYIFIGVCLYTVYQELIQATNIKSDVFIINLILSLVALVGASVFITIIFSNGDTPKVYAILGTVVIVVDAVASPIISFKMARRNIVSLNDH